MSGFQFSLWVFVTSSQIIIIIISLTPCVHLIAILLIRSHVDALYVTSYIVLANRTSVPCLSTKSEHTIFCGDEALS